MKPSTRCACYTALLGLLLLRAPGAHTQTEQRGQSGTAPTSSSSTPPAASRATQSQVDGTVPDDPTLTAIIAPYSGKVRELDTVIGQLEVELKKSGVGGGSLGNFVADAIRARAEKLLGKPVIFAATNSGGLRKNTIAPGPLHVRDIYELLPFENALVAVDLTGEQLGRFMQVILAKRDAQSGAVLAYRTNAEGKNELHSVTLGQQQAILPNATYTIVTIDYLVKRGGDYAVLEEAKTVRALGQTIRDAVLDYVRAETAAGRPINTRLDKRFHLQEAASASPSNTRPQ